MHKKQEQIERHIEVYSKAIDLDPKYARTYYNRGYAYSKLGLAEKSKADRTKTDELIMKFGIDSFEK